MEGSATMTSAPTTAPATTESSSTVTSETRPGTSVVNQPDKAPAPAAKGDEKAATPAQVAEAVRKFKLNVMGKEQEVDERTLISLAQKGVGADKKFNEAAITRKQNEEFIRLLKTNPEAVLNHPEIGLDARKWAEEFLYKRLQEDALSPEEKERNELRSKVEKFESEKKQQEETQKAAQFEELKEKFKGDLQTKIVSALETSQLPRTPYTIARMAEYMIASRQLVQQYAEKGVKMEALEPSDVAEFVWNDYMKEHQSLYGNLPNDKLLSLLNADVRKKIREAEMAAVNGSPTGSLPKVGAKDQPPQDPNKPLAKQPKMTVQEWRERNRKMMDAGE